LSYDPPRNQAIEPKQVKFIEMRKCQKSGKGEATHDVDDNKGTYRLGSMIHPKVKPLNLNKLSQCVADTPKKRGIKI
jgi:ribosomal protein L32